MARTPADVPRAFVEDNSDATDATDALCRAVIEPDLGWSLHVLSRAYADRAQQAVTAIPNGLRGYLLLTRVNRETAASQLALAGQLGLDRTVMTYLLDELQAAGLVQRRPDPTDRRARQVYITAAGKAALHEAQVELAAAEGETLAGLSTAERGTLCHLVHRVATALSQQPGAPTPSEACLTQQGDC